MASGYFTCLNIPPQHWRPRATLFVKATWRTKFSYKDIRYGGGVFVSIAPFGAAWTTTGGPECFGAVACVATDLESKRATLRGGWRSVDWGVHFGREFRNGPTERLPAAERVRGCRTPAEQRASHAH